MFIDPEAFAAAALAPRGSSSKFEKGVKCFVSSLTVDPELSSPGRLACRFAVEKADSIPWVNDGYY